MAHSLKLHSFKLCPFAHRARIALAEKGLTAETIEIDLKNKPAEFIRVSPYGRVPLLEHGGIRVWESAVILEYLDEAFPRPAVMGGQFTLADIGLYPWFEQLQTLQRLSGFPMPEDCEAIREWASAVAARPAVDQCSRPSDWYEHHYRQYLAA